MKTKIFENLQAFVQRTDKAVNGVTAAFAAEHPEVLTANTGNRGCWNCTDCSRCSGCSDCRSCSDCSDCSGCSNCSHCSNCLDCSDCSDCRSCSYCSDCSDCSAKKNNTDTFDVPTVPDIHQKVYEAARQPNALNMRDWHTCETTHCRAGWVVVLAGEAGRKLEAETTTLFAAMQIYKKSYPKISVSPPRFYDSDAVALADMKRCAEEEKLSVQSSVS